MPTRISEIREGVPRTVGALQGKTVAAVTLTGYHYGETVIGLLTRQHVLLNGCRNAVVADYKTGKPIAVAVATVRELTPSTMEPLHHLAGKRVSGRALTATGNPTVEGTLLAHNNTSGDDLYEVIRRDDHRDIWVERDSVVLVEAELEDTLNIRELLTGDLNRLRYINRYSTSLVIHKENVAEHSYYVALGSMMICRWVKQNTAQRPNVSTVLQRAIVHDMDESRTGDFQRPFKYSDPDLQTMLERAAEAELVLAVAPLFPNSPEFCEDVVHTWKSAKDDSLEGMIISFADYLSVISHLAAEVECANLSVLRHYETLQEYAQKFRASRFDLIRPLVDQSEKILLDLLQKVGVKSAVAES